MGENLTALGESATKEDIEVYARYNLSECLLSGNTTVVDIGMVQGLGERLASRIIGETGIRAYEGHIVFDGSLERVGRFDYKTE